MKVRKRFKTGIVAALSTLFIFSGVLNASIVNATEPAAAIQDGNVQGKAGIVMKIDLTEEDKKLLGDEDEFLKEVEKEGWKKTENGYEKFYPAKNGSLTINEQEVELTANGTFAINEDDANLDIQFKANGQEIKTNVKNDKNKSQSIDLVKTINFKDFAKSMDGEMTSTENGKSSRSEVGQKHSPGDRVHCNRFNGSVSNHRYYNHWDPRAWKNFVGSDCDYAFLSYDCQNDYTSNTNCRGLQSAYNYKNCSWALYHSNRYHYYGKSGH
ncbi:hypothetical protein [Lysinibacillus sp. FJAT-14222]|uniref:hypothetical protein n=1 Tax=Lysinibacillus sp. FJAT-14222 TaxID=1932366 RepID=UPI0006AF4AE9|nr:hypothetical protein [Lysinibacillus sp. FJAT-14222]